MREERAGGMELSMRESERDSAELALVAAHSGVTDATLLLDAAHAELHRIESAINARRIAPDGAGEIRDLERDALDARDTVSACEVALHEAQRIVAEYEDELTRLESAVRGLIELGPDKA